jgi:long-chain acyl-CoA synthetase
MTVISKQATVAKLTTQGRLRITGRVKELFKTSKGKYVAPVTYRKQTQ